VISSFRGAFNSVDAPIPVKGSRRANSLALARRDVPKDLLGIDALQAAGDLGLALRLCAAKRGQLSSRPLSRRLDAVCEARPSISGTNNPLAGGANPAIPKAPEPGALID